jgi:predicted enzyme related to lactoylglutathione lyase
MNPPLAFVLIYARDPQKTAEFYRKHFGFTTSGQVQEGLIELSSSAAGASLLIHQAAKSVKLGQVGVKLMFSVQDIEAFKLRSAALSLVFGSTHQARDYSFANAKDPDNNSVAITSRAFRCIDV